MNPIVKMREIITRRDIAEVHQVILLIGSQSNWFKQLEEECEKNSDEVKGKKETISKKIDIAIKFINLRKNRLQNYRTLLWMFLATAAIILKFLGKI